MLSASAIKCIGGKIIGKLWPRDDEERQAAIDAGYDLDEVLDTDRLVSGENVFFSATGVTDGDMLRGVHFQGPEGATTESLVMRSRSGTVRTVSARHDRAKLREITGGTGGLTSSGSSAGASAPTTDGARSSRASERRKAWVTITWILSWVIR